MARCMGTAYLIMQLIHYLMKVNGIMINPMAVGLKNTLMVVNTMGNFMMEKNKILMVNLCGVMVKYIKDSFEMGKYMVKVHLK